MCGSIPPLSSSCAVGVVSVRDSLLGRFSIHERCEVLGKLGALVCRADVPRVMERRESVLTGQKHLLSAFFSVDSEFDLGGLRACCDPSLSDMA
jgi:hypothetical protein